MPAPLTKSALMALLLASTALGGWTAVPPRPAHAETAVDVSARPGGFADLVDRVAPAVVQIAVIGAEAPDRAHAEGPARPRGGANPGGAGQRGAPALHRTLGEGSGFVVDPSGLVVTNFHVAGRAERIAVAFADGLVLPARVVGLDERTDLALLRVDPPHPLPTVRFAEGAPPRVGDWVLAAGNPFGLGPSVSVGIVSARGRVLGAGPYDDFLQTDASINPGNSGGPLFDGDGRVVGVNTAILSPSGGSAGIGFAVPAEIAAHVVAALRADGRVNRGWLGVEADTAAEAAPGGARIAAISAAGPGDRAGLRPGDVVTAIDGQPVRDARALARLVADQQPGSEVTLDVARGTSALMLRAVVRDQPTLASR